MKKISKRRILNNNHVNQNVRKLIIRARKYHRNYWLGWKDWIRSKAKSKLKNLKSSMILTTKYIRIHSNSISLSRFKELSQRKRKGNSKYSLTVMMMMIQID